VTVELLLLLLLLLESDEEDEEDDEEDECDENVTSTPAKDKTPKIANTLINTRNHPPPYRWLILPADNAEEPAFKSKSLPSSSLSLLVLSFL
jgi:hypothetical protein